MPPKSKTSMILITRPEPAASEFAKDCEKAGFECFVEPVLSFNTLDFEMPDTSQFDALVFTSAQAVRVFSSQDQDKSLPVYCVGENTAKVCKKKGYESVHAGPKDAEALVDIIAAQAVGRILYPRARDISYPLLTSLVSRNVQCEEVVVYEAVVADQLSQKCQDVLKNHQIAAIPFFSKRTAEVFLKLASEADLTSSLEPIKALCLSPKVLECVQTYSWRSSHVSPRPDRQGMIGLMKDHVLGEKVMSASKKKTGIENASEIIERFGGIRPMAKKIDVAVTTIQGWKKRDTIPAGRREQVLEAAASHNVDLSDIMSDAPPANENSKKTPDTKAVVENPADFEVQKAEFEPEEKTLEEAIEEAVELKDEVVDEPASSVPTSVKAEKLSEPLDKRIAEAEQKAVAKSMWISVGLLLIGLAAIAALLWPQKKDTFENDQRLSAIENNLDNVQGDVEAVKQQQSFFGALIPDNLDEQLSNLQDKASATQAQIGQVIEKAQEVSSDVLGEEGGTFEERAVKLQTHVAEIASAPQMSELLDRFNFMQEDEQGASQLDQTMAELSAVLSNARDQALNGGQEVVGGTVDSALEAARQQSTAVSETFENVPSNDLKAAALLLGMTQFRSSLNRDNEAFANDLNVLMGLIGEENVELRGALERLAPHAESGVLTTGGLSTEFKTLAGDAVVASLKGEDVSLGEKAQARFNEVFQVEKNGELVTGTDTQIQLDQAQSLLESGDLEGAIASVQNLDGDAASVMQPWLDEAQITLMARKARTLLEGFMGSQSGTAGGASGVGAGLGIPGSSKLIKDEQTGINVLKRNELPSFGMDKKVYQ